MGRGRALSGIFGEMLEKLLRRAQPPAKRHPTHSAGAQRQSLLNRAAGKVPAAWGEGRPNRSGVGTRWHDPTRKGNSIRIDAGVPGSDYPSQRVDHAVINSGGRVLGPDGRPIAGRLKDHPEGHIPVTEWLTWTEWNRP